MQGLQRIGARDVGGPEIRSTLLRALALLVVVLGGGFFAVQLLSARSAVRELSASTIRATADRLEKELDGFFGPVRTQLGILAAWGREGLLDIGDAPSMQRLLVPLLELHPQLSSAMVADGRGREFLLLQQRDGWLSRQTGIERDRARELRFRDASSPPEQRWRSLDYDPRRRPWYRGIAQSADPSEVHWTSAYAFFTSREPGITASLGWRDAGGGISRVVALDVLLRDVSQFTTGLEVGPRGRALVLDEQGRVIGLPRDERLRPEDARDEALLSPVESLGVPGLTHAYRSWLDESSDEREVFSYRADDQNWWAGFRRYPLGADRNLWIGVAMPEADLLGGLDRRRDEILATTGVGLILAVAMAFALDRAIRHRLDRVMSRVQKAGQYTLEEEIGSGGMGTVYRARHAMLARPTAVKLLRNASEEDVARFEREVQLTSRLTHPNTVAVYDFGRTPRGGFYYAMEYLPGLTLEALVRHVGALPPERVIAILVQICGSLEEAHSMGLVHRDIKPGNIILCERGGRHDVAKVLDFGLVKDLGSEQQLTRTHSVTGSPLYLSPETLRGSSHVEARSDLYSLGATGYFLLTGQPVFTGNNAWLVALMHVREAPRPPSQVARDPIPKDLEEVLMACLAKEAAERPASAADLAARLEACRDAGRWTEARARDWWREHSDLLARYGVEGGVPAGVGSEDDGPRAP